MKVIQIYAKVLYMFYRSLYYPEKIIEIKNNTDK